MALGPQLDQSVSLRFATVAGEYLRGHRIAPGTILGAGGPDATEVPRR